jgi:hypothetical protein
LKKTLLVLFILLSFPVTAQQHPVAVESAALLAPGDAKIDLGLSYFRSQSFPLSGLSGNLLKFGNIRFAVSLSDYVELQTDGTLLNLLEVTKRDSAFNSQITSHNTPTGDIGDFTLWTKFKILNEYRSGIGFAVRFGIQLPNASNESGLGIDEMNFFSSLLIQKHLGGLLTMNAGLGILGDPTVLGQQHDVFIYGLEYMVPVSDDVSVIIQSAGRNGHSGTGVYPLSNAKAGIEYTTRDVSVKIFGVANFSPRDRARGIEISVSHLFHVIDIPQ